MSEESIFDESGGEEEFYEVDKIVDHKSEGKKVFYKVRWKGYSPGQDTWEPQEHLGEGCDEVIATYFDWRAANFKNKYKRKGATADTPRNETKGTKGNKQSPSSGYKPTDPNLLKMAEQKAFMLAEEFRQINVTKPEATSKPYTVTSAGAQPMKVDSKFRLFQETTESDTGDTDMEDSGNLSTDTSSPSVEKAKEKMKTEETFKCSHQAEYTGKLAQDYETLSRRYEVKLGPKNFVTESRKCVTVLMSQLCNPSCPNMDTILDEMRVCVAGWGRKAYQQLDAVNLSLTAALLLIDESDILDNQHQFKYDIGKAVPGHWTPLHFAAALHKFDVCDWILRQNSWSDIVTINRMTPLTLALRVANKSTEEKKLEQFVLTLISEGANVVHKDSFEIHPAEMARKNGHMSIADLLDAQLRRLRDHTSSLIKSHLGRQKDLYLKGYFLDPQLITQPPNLTYTIRFTFKDPAEPVVARLMVAYSAPANIESQQNISSVPVILTNDGPCPFKTLTLNGQDILPKHSEMSVTLRSQLVVGNNVLELEMIDFSEGRLLDTAVIFGCLIGKSS